jgi:hypothetical protein
MSGKILVFAAAVAASSGVAVGVTSTLRQPADVPVQRIAAQFDAFDDIEEQAPLKKADKVAAFVGAVSTVKVEQMLAPAKVEIEADVSQNKPRVRRIVQAEEPAPRRTAERNVCTRHGMRKVLTRGGKSWRCRR